MPITEPTMQLRWRKATEQEMLNNPCLPMRYVTGDYPPDFYILEQAWRVTGSDYSTLQWRPIEIESTQDIKQKYEQ